MFSDRLSDFWSQPLVRHIFFCIIWLPSNKQQFQLLKNSEFSENLPNHTDKIEKKPSRPLILNTSPVAGNLLSEVCRWSNLWALSHTEEEKNNLKISLVLQSLRSFIYVFYQREGWRKACSALSRRYKYISQTEQQFSYLPAAHIVYHPILIWKKYPLMFQKRI